MIFSARLDWASAPQRPLQRQTRIQAEYARGKGDLRAPQAHPPLGTKHLKPLE
jgi:hypothetical protein